MNSRSLLLTLLLALSSGFPANAEVTLPAVFGPHMVVQREMPVRVWGWASPGERIAGSLGDHSFAATAADDGRWSATIDPLTAGGPLTLTVKGADQSLQIPDVYVGEVWLCSGQSNMAMTVNRVLNADQEIAAADFPMIRMFRESSPHSTSPQEKCSGTWSVCGPDTVSGFSATAYFFGRELSRKLNVPIGLINSSVGGTSIESWTSMDAQLKNPAVEPCLARWKADDDAFDPEAAQARYETALKRWEALRDTARENRTAPPRKPVLAVQPRNDRNHPSNLFNGKIQPLVGYTLRGAIWYQGENNAGRGLAHLYGAQLETMITDWRTRWGQGDFPFAWVQLPNYRAAQTQPSETSGWVLVQEGMRKTLDRVPGTGMAITVDIGEATDIHPRNKQDVGRRLSYWALGDVYGGDETTSGPLYLDQRIDGNHVLVEFNHTAKGLVAKDGELKGFAIAGKDRQFHWAKARVEGKCVVVWSDQVASPVSVRYAWASNPDCNLFNSAGLPASPFRTDNWDEPVTR